MPEGNADILEVLVSEMVERVRPMLVAPGARCGSRGPSALSRVLAGQRPLPGGRHAAAECCFPRFSSRLIASLMISGVMWRGQSSATMSALGGIKNRPVTLVSLCIFPDQAEKCSV
jgi:hypothetical protein